ncbi:MAG: hypothetical protein BWY43_00302 [candidate division WS2 bacterium ADurb.Bin280]|uniref:Uncharacterized protein n=1 Tax=candidate division WS2 bacterium ADurb.Bin280 TaxID=1852829 RepID=A0A1V5SFF9_9BACT|nr:MAG: hypothetical protein BWY43_00302 [candidate division WS2 bacterium ADurb.Bin280]
MKNKKLLAIIVIAIIIIAGIISYLVYSNSQLNKEIVQKEEVIESIMLAQTQEPTANVSVASSATKTATKTSTTTSATSTPINTKSDEELIAQALYEKFSTDASTMSYTISKKTDSAATGGITFTEGGGGYFVAAKENGLWKIIADGNGVIECDILDQYDIPASIVGDCFDSATGESRER